MDYSELIGKINAWARDLGLQQVGISSVDQVQAQLVEERLRAWLQRGWHGDMDFMARHGQMRTRPDELLPGTLRIISVRLDYLPMSSFELLAKLANPEVGYIACYAMGRDYHRLMRRRLEQLAQLIVTEVGPFAYRAYVDSAPVMEKPLAEQAGLGWIGKHTNLVNCKAGSWFFLGELYVNLPLPSSEPAVGHCGRCQACIKSCPTGAIVAPYKLDARRCIAYLTIEAPGCIPELLRPLIGNRIFGCDDCQLVCPWNHFAQITQEPDFLPRKYLQSPQLVDLFAWSESEFLRKMEGSSIRRLGWQRWLRNIAVALGNAPANASIVAALRTRADHPSELVREHVHWALEQQTVARRYD
ncbi:epoxyqueuosine reductase [Achromatium sp. WMS2]|nr:epoxyqueuosine reductase [Achromatium sp. WMS2]